MPSRNKNSNQSNDASENTSSLPNVLTKLGFGIDSSSIECRCFEGETLSFLLNSISNAIESERKANKVAPDKFWFKQQFAIGVNEVTRLLERMPSLNSSSSVGDDNTTVSTPQSHLQHRRFAVPVKLQAVLVASDCNPRWLTKHLPSLAASRGVPIIQIKENKEGSLRLGELVKVKTAIAIGVKAKGNNINKLFEEILRGEGQNSWREMSAGLPSVATESAPLVTTL